ncbi:ElyC/SanA/YdcF family protein [Flavobacterium sp. DG1-102-2]|uniref:ElyC/SanA/YdcF family protein n=1 Tax=Flavobacterium sp. DG1-102-2 TaxID=3081663 RepID=UPI00294993AB|nr:ElyC/SanA/YdcF family protein [Flavobacterium sp. DG1-102-2]MDV6170015.1 ElyC/SanA/YdcF family protein [Flavobacterium sp. DG1-102-2]
MTIFNPVTIFFLFIIAALVLYKFEKEKAGKIVVILAFAEIFLFSVTPLPVYLLRQLEQQYPVYKGSERLPILVLGNYHAEDNSLYPSQKLSVQSLERVTEGVRIYKSSTSAPIAFSGYAVNDKVPTATIASEAAVSLGVAPKDTITLTSPRNTYEEALAYKKRFGTQNKFILVTNATHMPRAMLVFKKLGMKPIPAPTGFFIKEGTREAMCNWYPSSFKLVYTEMAFYEYSAQLYYKWFK